MAEGRERDLRLDLIRGYCLVSMVVDHVGNRLSWLFWVTGKSPFALITGVDGFVLISGVLVGMVSRERVARDGLAETGLRLLRRAGQLYIVTVLLSVLYLVLGLNTPLLGHTPQVARPAETAAAVLGMALTWDDVLPMYVLLLALSPLAILLLDRGKTRALLLASGLVWACHLVNSGVLNFSLDVVFPPAAWQVVFVIGLVVGYHRLRLEQLARTWRGRLVVAAGCLSAAALLLLAVVVKTITLEALFPGTNFAGLYANVYDWYRLPPLRLLATLTWVGAAYVLAGLVWRPLRAALGWLLLPLGQASLYVFALHLPVVTLVTNVPGFRALPDEVYGLGLLVPVLILWAMVKTRFLFAVVPR